MKNSFKALATFIFLFLVFCNTVSAETKLFRYGDINIIDITDASANERANVVKNANASDNTCTIICEFQEYSVNTSILWNNSFSKEDFVNIVMNYEPDGMYSGTSGWRVFYQNFAESWFDISTSYGLNPAFMVCVSCWQSGFGTSRLATECGNLFGLPEYRDTFYGNVPQRSVELLQMACEQFLKNESLGTTVLDIGTWMAPEDPEFSYGIAKLMNKLFGYLNDGQVQNIQIIVNPNRVNISPIQR